MKSTFIDSTGQTFCRLTVVGIATRSADNKPRFECQCVCGNFVIVRGKSLRNGTTKSCGCLRRERRRGPTPGLKLGKQAPRPLWKQQLAIARRAPITLAGQGRD